MQRIQADKILHALRDFSSRRLDRLEVLPEIDSTNNYLRQQPAPEAGRIRVVIAEHQTAGRGRYGRRWIASPMSGLCMSVSYTFAASDSPLAGLTLAAGLSAINALNALGLSGIALKWPNDLIARDRKLGGILAESRVRSSGAIVVLLGIGINVELPPEDASRVLEQGGAGAIDIAGLTDDLPAIETLAATTVEHLYATLDQFEKTGLSPFLPEWQRYDWLRGREISVETPEGAFTGIADGVDDDGSLNLRSDDGMRNIISGSIDMAALPVPGT